MIQLRPYESDDAQTILPWIGDEVAFRKWCADRYETYPISAYDMNKQYDTADHERFFPMTAIDESGIFGHLIMRFPDDDRSVLRFGFVIVDDRKRGKGYGKRMLETAVSYALERFGVKRITLGVFDNNEAAYRCYLSVGFRETNRDNVLCVFGEEWECIEMEYICS